MTETRIYVVLQKDNNTNTQRVVEASSAAQAIKHCVRGQFSAHVPNTKELADLIGQSSGKNPLIVERAIEAVQATSEQ